MSPRLALKLLFSGGKRTVSRQMLITVSVAIGAVLLFAGLSLINLFNQYDSRDCWRNECVNKVQSLDEQEHRTPNLQVALQADFYQGRSIQVIHVAPLTDQASIHGVPQVPEPDQYYASPELARLLDTEPKNQLGDRYAELSRAGLIADQQLDSPKQLTIIVGHDQQDMSKYSEVKSISNFYPRKINAELGEQAVVLLALGGLLLPVLVLIGSSTRIASQRREENQAALRLVGATTSQTKILTALDALIGAGVGSIAGLLMFELVRRTVLSVRGTDLPFNFVDPNVPPLFKLLVVLAVPLAAIAAGLWALRRVNISPLGVSRKVKSSSPRARRVVVLLLGAAMFTGSVIGLNYANEEGAASILVLAMMLGFMLTMIGLVIAGPWMLLKFSQLLSRIAGSASLLIAAKRMQYDPKSSFRVVAGVVMVVFFGAWVSGSSTATFSSQTDTAPGNLQNVLPILFNKITVEDDVATLFPSNISPERSAEIERGLTSVGDIELIKIYGLTPPDQTATDDEERNSFGGRDSTDVTGIISCSDLVKLGGFGSCASGQIYKGINFVGVAIDHPFGPDQTGDLPSEPADIAKHNLQGYMIRADSQASVEKIRTYFASQVPESAVDYELKTFGEDIASAKAGLNTLRNGFNALVSFVLVVALMSMTISAVGSILERRRSYTMLRLAGVNTNELSKTVYYESLLPLIVFTLFSGALGYGSALLLNSTVEPPSGFHPPSSSLLIILAIGYLVGAGITWLTLPLLRKVSNPAEIHYE